LPVLPRSWHASIRDTSQTTDRLLSKPPDEAERRFGDLAPSVIDRERMPTVVDLDVLSDADVANLTHHSDSRHRHVPQNHHGCASPRAIHSRMYAGQLRSVIPVSSRALRNRTASRSTRTTPLTSS